MSAETSAPGRLAFNGPLLATMPLESVYWLVVALSVCFGVLPIVLTLRFGRKVTAPPKPIKRTSAGRVAAIIPCKGIDQGFDSNIEALLTQDCPNLQLIFVVATADDPAHTKLSDLLIEHAKSRSSSVSASLSVAGIDNRRAQKLTNQLYGVAQIDQQTDFIVFLDSDLRPDRGFIGRLVEPLSSDAVGATTGFRWYHPPTPTFGSMLRSTWNAGALPLLTNPSSVFAFGGAMAIARTTFERARIVDLWERALSDDFPFTLGVKRLGLEIRFIPSCIAVSFESSSLAETLEFTNRQSVISRVYFPPLWWSAAIAHSLANLFIITGLVAIGYRFAGGAGIEKVLSWCLVLVPLECINAALLLNIMAALLPSLARDLRQRGMRYVLLAPIASLISLLNTLHSLSTRQIVWRGVRYELVSDHETRVLLDN